MELGPMQPWTVRVQGEADGFHERAPPVLADNPHCRAR
jgi:hypothetical protein